MASHGRCRGARDLKRRSLDADETLLREVLAEVVRSSGDGDVLEVHDRAVALAIAGIAERYFGLWDDEEPRERIRGAVEEEFDRTRQELAAVCDEALLLDREPVLQASIARRNPYVDPLSYVQIELLRRLRAGAGDDEALRRVSLLTVNGIAGGLRNTG